MDCWVDLKKVGLDVTWVIAMLGIWVMLMISNYFVHHWMVCIKLLICALIMMVGIILNLMAVRAACFYLKVDSVRIHWKHWLLMGVHPL